MNIRHLLKPWVRPALYGLGGWAFLSPLSGRAANTNVSILNASFSPPAVTINVNDQVTWNWVGSLPHDTVSSSTPPLWNSGLFAGSHSFSFTFTNAGSYPYKCTFHGFTGSVTVQSANTPPNVAITVPASGTTFSAPWTGMIQAAVSDPGGTVTKVDFFAGGTLLGTVNNPSPTPSLTVTNLGAGNHTLTAVATDNGGATNTSAGVNIAVVTPVPIVLSAPQRVSASAVQFDYSANPGLRYIVLRAAVLPAFSAISTNTASSSTVTYLDNNASGPVNFYRLQLAPNP